MENSKNKLILKFSCQNWVDLFINPIPKSFTSLRVIVVDEHNSDELLFAIKLVPDIKSIP